MSKNYLNKKTWHPEKFSNIEKVYNAENKKDEENRLMQERIKKLKEEKHIEELKRLQVEAGMIPKSNLERLDWMYTDRTAMQNEQTAEEYLLGKPVNQTENKEQKPLDQNQEQD